MVKPSTKYRARGKYRRTNRDSWITTVWRASEQEAKDDIKMFGHGYDNARIVKKDKYSLKRSW